MAWKMKRLAALSVSPRCSGGRRRRLLTAALLRITLLVNLALLLLRAAALEILESIKRT